MTGLKVDIVGVDALGEAEWAEWRAMLAADPALDSPYFRPEFTQVAARISPDAAVAVFSHGGRTVGFFPHQKRGGAMQPLAAPMNDYHGVIARPGEAPSLEEVARTLGATRLNVTAWVGATGADGRDLGEPRRTVQVQLGPDGYDGWYSERRSSQGKFFKDKERARRSMESELGTLRVERGLRDPALLDWLIGLKRDQYKRTGRHDIFACGWTADLLHALLKEDRDGFGASMAGLWAGDRLTALEYSLHAGDQYHFWFPGYEPSLARCSPGILLSMDTMRLAAELGYRTFDFGFEGEHYKKYFCNGSRTVREALVLRPGLGAAVSQAAVGALNLAGGGRGERLRASVRRRWAAIEACETTPGNRLRGAAQAAGAALAKARRPSTRTVPA
ncbi:CelD/BcsL family acetyltransferase involved in cellulose biosynthesis [Brevundimonas alba]|uniref:CelD/BcsL family acetyltransferase involved in cellulose biosynthesis n=1 Tax=Brevundimonas alba TaxID=74314 RepID=A0A7X6BPS7_9CAUL|nr:GNAT family N-acetyltransferase [Brevundimonas alba]NJC42757.1 CelD/BcsL family acetyltransferase involved in cellulose biosynthesis [Brevundimonas alba]